MSVKSVKRNVGDSVRRFEQNKFLFEQLVNRDFKHKYKGTVLGMMWSILAPLFNLLVMRLVFANFFGRTVDHYTTYLFCGNLVFSYYRESTTSGMSSLLENAGIITKINVPKYLFLFSKNISALINFALTLVVFFVFCILDDITFTPKMLLLVYPTLCLMILNIGVGLILSAMFVFFRDMTYLYNIFLTVLTYVSAIFYDVSTFSESVQRLFLLNPVYVIIKYYRLLVIDATIPSLQFSGLCLLYPMIFLLLGFAMYRKFNRKFVYYF